MNTSGALAGASSSGPGALESARRAVLLLLAVACFGCTKQDRAVGGIAEEARFGIFYGGQIQERNELPFQLDATRQRQGFRIVLLEAFDDPVSIDWEISRPGAGAAKAGVSRPERRVSELGSATLQPGQLRFEQLLPFRPGDPLGLWNIRVVLGEHVLLDRPFNVYDEATRRAAIQAARVIDSGL